MKWPAVPTEGMRNLYGDIVDDDDLPKEALVFNTEPAVPPSRARVAAAPPTRGLSLSIESLQRDPKSDTFDYLLKDIEGDNDVLETEDIKALVADEPVRIEEAIADEAFLGLANFPDAYDKEDEEKHIADGFQFDPIPKTWAKRSNRKRPSRFPRYAKQEVEASLDVEQFLDEPGIAEDVKEDAQAVNKSEITSGLDSLFDAGAETAHFAVIDTNEHEAINTFSSTIPQENDSHANAANDGPQRVSLPAQIDAPSHTKIEDVPCNVTRETSTKLLSAGATVEAHVDDIPDLSLNPFFDASHNNRSS